MLYKDLKPILYSDNKELFELIFESGKFSFAEPIMIDQLSLYDNNDKVVAKEAAEKFSCRIDSNGDDIWVPAGLPFDIKPSRDPYSEMIITRNGISYYPNYIEDTTEINVEFTSIGEKLNQYAKDTYTNIVNAHEQIDKIENIFGVAIIK